jgi:transposase
MSIRRSPKRRHIHRERVRLMAASPGGRVSKAVQARRLEIIRALWPTDRTTAVIAERLGVSESHVSDLARRAGLPPRHNRSRQV